VRTRFIFFSCLIARPLVSLEGEATPASYASREKKHPMQKKMIGPKNRFLFNGGCSRRTRRRYWTDEE